MTRLVTVIAAALGFLAGCARADSGITVGRFSLETIALLVTAFLFYVALSGAITAISSRAWRARRPGRRPVEHVGLSDFPGKDLRPGSEVAGRQA
jgi:hypothetical protein